MTPWLDHASYGAVLLYLLAGHAIADYPLQGDCHATIHALAVFLATGSMAFAIGELIAHTIIDHTKCAGRISYNTDQKLHILCKLLWFELYFLGWFV